jgi:hypothetical protein
MSTQRNLLMVLGVITIGLIYLLCRERLPDLHGMTVEDADAFLEQQNGKYQLGRQIGFLEPKPGQIRLLGKIAEQVYTPSAQPDEPGVFDYKLYQIDVDKLDQYVAAVQSAAKVTGEATIDDMDMTEFAKQMEEFKLLAEELAKAQPIAPEPIMFPPAPPPPPRREPRREPPRDPRDMRHAPKRRPRIMEFGFAAPKTNANPLRLAVPDRVNSHKVHKSKESFFW